MQDLGLKTNRPNKATADTIVKIDKGGFKGKPTSQLKKLKQIAIKKEKEVEKEFVKESQYKTVINKNLKLNENITEDNKKLNEINKEREKIREELILVRKNKQYNLEDNILDRLDENKKNSKELQNNIKKNELIMQESYDEIKKDAKGSIKATTSKNYKEKLILQGKENYKKNIEIQKEMSENEFINKTVKSNKAYKIKITSDDNFQEVLNVSSKNKNFSNVRKNYKDPIIVEGKDSEELFSGGEYITSQKVIYINRDENIINFNFSRTKKNSLDLDIRNSTGSKQGIFYHEYGHFVDARLKEKNIYFNAIIKKYSPDITFEEIKEEITDYATKNYAEAFAELFAVGISENYNPNLYSSKVRNLINGLIETATKGEL